MHSLLQKKAVEQERASDSGPQDASSKNLLSQLRLSNLDELSKAKAPMEVSLALFGTTSAVTLFSGVCMACSGYYTPLHTNTFSIIASTMAQATMMAGCGGLAGLRYANFCVMPSMRGQLDTKSWIREQMTGPAMFAILPFACIFTSLTMIDGMSLYALVPACLGYGLFGTSIYLKSLDLEMPLWMSKQLFRLIVLGIFGNLCLGYMILRRDWNMRDNRALHNNIQGELNQDKEKYSKASIQQRQESRVRR